MPRFGLRETSSSSSRGILSDVWKPSLWVRSRLSCSRGAFAVGLLTSWRRRAFLVPTEVRMFDARNATFKVAIVDYGMGNLYSVRRACENADMDALITSSAAEML